MRKNMDRDAEVMIIFKEKDSNGDHEDMTIKDIDIKTAHKIYKKLIHQWKTKKWYKFLLMRLQQRLMLSLRLQ